MANSLKCAHGIAGDVNVILECNRSLKFKIDHALDALRSPCAWRKGNGYYISECFIHDDLKFSHSASSEPERWKFCPYCGGVIPKPLFTVDDEDQLDPHG